MRHMITICLATLLAGCSDMCANDIISQTQSPDGAHIAVMFQRDCGATTGYSTQISIRDADDDLSGWGNTFRADTDHGAADGGRWGGPWAEMQWLSSERLLVRYAEKSRIFEQDARVEGITIVYEAVKAQR